MPVIGAMPMFIPTLRKTWNSSAATMAPATVAVNRLSATATTLMPRHTTIA